MIGAYYSVICWLLPLILSRCTTAVTGDIITSQEPCTPTTSTITTPVTIVIRTDGFPEETSWEITDPATSKLYQSSTPYTEMWTVHNETYCLVTDAVCLEFKIEAKSEVFNSYYNLFWNGNIVKEGRDFGARERTIFGGACPTDAPTATVVAATLPPTVTGSNAPAVSPTRSPSPTHGPTEFSDGSPAASLVVLVVAFPVLVVGILILSAVVYMCLTGKQRREYEEAVNWVG